MAGAFLAGIAFSAPVVAQPVQLHQKSPALIITNEPLPESLKSSIYSRPQQMRVIRPEEISGQSYFTPTDTVVGKRVHELQGDLATLQQQVLGFSSELEQLQRQGEARAADYYAAVATISTQLQSGTTPGNPRLEARLQDAQVYLEDLGQNLARLNQLAVRTANAASNASFIQESVRSAYGLSGGIEEDHVHLAQLEDAAYNTVIIIERVLNNANDDITRTSAYLATERNNLRTLSVAVSNGDLYNKSLANRPFSRAGAFDAPVAGAPVAPVNAAPIGESPAPAPQSAPETVTFNSPRILAKVKFDRPDVDYEQALYIAVNEALQRYPNARFELVAVHPSQGNAAKVAIESTRARRNAERVLRSLTQMGLSMDDIDLSYAQSETVAVNEVHLYVK